MTNDMDNNKLDSSQMTSPVSTAPLDSGGGDSISISPSQAKTWLDEIKHSYLTFLSEMDYDLEEGFKHRLAEVTHRVSNATTEQELVELGVELKNIIAVFARLAFGVKAEAAQLVNDIFDGLSKVESRLQTSASHIRHMHNAGRVLTDSVSTNVQEMREQLGYANDISTLKAMVSEKLQQFQESVSQYQADGQQHIIAITQELDSLRKEFKSTNQTLNQLKSEKEHLAKKARTDSLTGAFNRLALEERLKDEMNRFVRYGTIFSILMLDLDHFKKVNDNFGHQVGDRCLMEVVSKIKSRVRNVDFVARYGGEEFVVITPETDATGGLVIAEKLRSSIENTYFMVRGGKVPLTISVGVSEVRQGDQDAQDVIARADQALYDAKSAGRNQVLAT